MKIAWIRRFLFALAPAAAAALLAAQTASTTHPAAQPTNPVPDVVLTPGSASLTPGASSTTPGSNSDVYSIPKSTPVGMPSHTTPMAGGSGATGVPTSLADCAGNGWRAYSGLGFQSEKNCEDWVSRHPAGVLTPRPAASTAGGSAMTTPSHKTAPAHRPTVRHPVNPARRATPPAEPIMESTPGSSITPLLNPTPAR